MIKHVLSLEAMPALQSFVHSVAIILNDLEGANTATPHLQQNSTLARSAIARTRLLQHEPLQSQMFSKN